MKKIIIVFAIVLIANLSCKKIACGCDPVGPAKTSYIGLVIKGANGEDVLNPSSPSYISYNSIQLFQKDEGNATKEIKYTVNPPFSYNNSSQFKFYQLFSTQIPLLAKSGNKVFYLKIGSQSPLELTVFINSSTTLIDKIQVANKDLIRDVSMPNEAIFYLNL